MTFIWKETQHWLVLYKRTHQMDPRLVPIIQAWIEVQVSRFGDGLDREDTCQSLWLFVCGLIRRKLNTRRGNWHSWLLMCIRQEITKIRKKEGRKARNLGNHDVLVVDGSLDERELVYNQTQVGRSHRLIDYDIDAHD